MKRTKTTSKENKELNFPDGADLYLQGKNDMRQKNGFEPFVFLNKNI